MTETTEFQAPFDHFAQWMSDAEEQETNDPNALSLATTTKEGRPSVRMVLLKEMDERGFVFYTNLESRKGRELLENPHASMCFHWKSLRRQVRIDGPVEQVTDEEADAYFHSRPRLSQIGAWASSQSRRLENRFHLEKRVAEYTAKFGIGSVPRPDYWHGFRLIPQWMEFWEDRPFRLHDRLVFTRAGDGWTTEHLFP
ncbi:pyridoxamine 5'-phosphate oxidase [Magnetospira sp. QH-2]|uniref:pyridoxamine 5'-phosphate oxidase n=1 Tax=Magnetospira sp. (strain QH-2) TaxID=1288970 RepID=UPI0003E81BA6|nr:pyridoxamine 5'-phosphate oxidase [Magnetospira sp. QH-2]CCQ73992.1 Pyridoxamine 5'-phosphate oxidase [Magnetospira sp. QH-2]